eukprot:4595633-Alexandrium_andersonii.AAC.1
MMHTKDLGVYSELCGSLLWSFVYDSDLEGNAQQKLDRVWTRIRALYDDLKVDVRMSNLSLQMFTDPRSPYTAFPSLSAHAAECRALVRVLVQICTGLNKGTARDMSRLQCGLAFLRFDEILHTAGMFLTQAEHTRAMDSLCAAMALYSGLTQHYSQRGIKCFNL